MGSAVGDSDVSPSALCMDQNDEMPGNIMQDTLTLSTRRWATAVDAAIAQMHCEASQRERR